MPQISVIMPVYNTREDWLIKAIDSVLNQTFRNFEFIIINDQSTESHVAKVLNEYKDREKIISILNTEGEGQKGISEACNLAIKKAEGEWIARMDSDDEWLPQKLEAQLNFVNTKKPNADIVLSDAYLFDMDGKVLSEARGDPEMNFGKRSAAFNDATLIKKTIYTERKIWYRKNYDGAEDYDFYMRCFLNKDIIWLKHPVCVMKTRILGDRHSYDFMLNRGNIAHEVWKESGLPPFMSLIKPEDEYQEQEIYNSLILSHNTSFELVENADQATGSYIINTGLPSSPDRIATLVDILETNPHISAVGSFVKKGNKVVTFITSSDQIERALLRGHCPIEEQSLVYRNYQRKEPPKKRSKKESKTPSKELAKLFFAYKLIDLCNKGQVINYPKALVDGSETYSLNTGKNSFIKDYAIKNLKVINVLMADIRSKDGYSGIDRYTDTLTKYCLPHIRFHYLRFNVTTDTEFKILINKNTIDVFYNSQIYKLTDTYDLVWNALKDKFANSYRFIIHSNCFDLYTFQKYMRNKINCKLLFTMHTAPYREIARSSFETYKKLEKKYEDETIDFNEAPEHYDALQTVDKVITVIDDAQEYLNRIDADVFTAPSILVRNGSESFNRNPVSPSPHHIEDDQELNPLRVLFVGHSSPRKGIDQIISIIEKTPNVQLHWAGPADPKIVSNAKEKGIPLYSYGMLKTNQLKELYEKCHVLAVGANFEMCSYAILEAMSTGLPIIATNVYGVRATIEDAGLLIRAPYGIIDQDDFKEGLQKLQNADFYNEMARRSLKRFELFKAERMAEETFAVYEDFFKK